MKRVLLHAFAAAAVLISAVACNNTSGGGGGGTTSASLYNKYGGAATITTAVDNVAGALLADPVTSPFFGPITAAGNGASVTKLLACLDLQFTALFGGPATYPGRTTFRGVDAMCFDMQTAHKNLHVTDAAFSKFLDVTVAQLLALGVTQADIDTLAPTLLGLQTDIVGR